MASSGAKRGAIGQLEAKPAELEYSTLQEEVDGAAERSWPRGEIRHHQAGGGRQRRGTWNTKRPGEASTEVIEAGRIRAASLQRDLVNATEGGFIGDGPVDGAVLRLHVNAARRGGAGRAIILSEMGCAR